MRVLTGGACLLGLALLLAQFIGATPGVSPSEARSRDDKINLALRRTAHHLLRAAGDSTSRILPVQRTGPHTFQLRLTQAFDYDTLPALLQASFRLHRITEAYDVAVLDCTTGQVQLGYSVTDLMDNQPVPCSGRARRAGCYTLQVTLAPPAAPAPRTHTGWLLAAGGLLIGLLYISWQRALAPQTIPAQTIPTEPADVNPDQVRFGNTILDLGRQTLRTAGTEQNLTYREAKLLRLLVQHANRVLERDAILKAVWEDEGITVGRSVDVFVSRLRKLVQADPAVRIVAVHGVGYRLEVRTGE
ncbi:DNA-binding winged helix-turn-helix (wHTH) protein [Spirosoma lacussanchae]|nr:winged helix-turn-helix domain-containing protein [Spirosoma lacussanchae]